jgi:hypothetical protein
LFLIFLKLQIVDFKKGLQGAFQIDALRG